MKHGVVLKYNFNKGDEKKYHSITTITREANEKMKLLDRSTSRFEAIITTKTIEVEEDGSAHLVSHIMPVSQEINEQRVDLVKNKQVVYILMNPWGKILEMSGTVSPSSLAFPDGELKEEETWEEETLGVVPGMDKPIKVMNRCRLEEFIKLNGYECAKIGVTTDEATFEMTYPSEIAGVEPVPVRQMFQSYGEVYFAYKDGFLLKQYTNIHAVAKMRDNIIDTTTNISMVYWDLIPEEEKERIPL